MANETKILRRGGSIPIASDSAALFGEIQSAPPEPVEDPSRWHPVTVEEAEVCRLYNATPDDLMAWRQFKFPTPRTKQIASRFSWWTKVKRSYVKEDLDRWDDSIRDLTARLPEKVEDEMKGHEQLEDIYLTCVMCGSDFRHAVDEQIVFLQKGFLHKPKRCKPCQALRRQGTPLDRVGR